MRPGFATAPGLVRAASGSHPRSCRPLKRLGRCFPAKGLARPAVEGSRHGRKVVRAVHAEIGAFREVLAQQPVGGLVRAALPGTVGVAEVDLKTSIDPQAGVLAHLRPLIPGQRSPQVLGQGGDRARDGVAHRLDPMPGECRPVLGARSGWSPHRGAVAKLQPALVEGA